MSHHDAQQTLATDEVRDVSRFLPMFPALMGVGLAALVIAAAVAGGDWKLFGMSYLVGYASFLTISIGALFFVVIQYLTRAGWSVTVRRLAECMAVNTFSMVFLLLPVLIFMTSIYHWADHHHVENDLILQEKAAWLNGPFWIGRMALYLTVLLGVAAWFWRNSILQDRTGEREITEKLEGKAGLMVVLFALATNFGTMDLLMTLDPHWYSTMFGVYCFAGGFLNFCAISILLLRYMQSRGVLEKSVTTEHYHDLGKFMFAFVFFWGYVAFSQWMLIWYANIPEETIWFAKRGATTDDTWAPGPWGGVAIILLLGHWLIPFVILFSRWTKRKLGRLTFWAAWMFVMHFVDMFWIVMPEYTNSAEGAGTHPVTTLVTSLLCWIGIGAIWLAMLMKIAAVSGLVPQKDPRIGEALAHEVY